MRSSLQPFLIAEKHPVLPGEALLSFRSKDICHSERSEESAFYYATSVRPLIVASPLHSSEVP